MLADHGSDVMAMTSGVRAPIYWLQLLAPFHVLLTKPGVLLDWTIFNFAFPLVRILWQKLLLLCSLNILKVFVYFLCFYARFKQMTFQPIQIVLFCCLNTLIIGLDLLYALCCNWVLPVSKYWFFWCMLLIKMLEKLVKNSLPVM